MVAAHWNSKLPSYYVRVYRHSERLVFLLPYDIFFQEKFMVIRIEWKHNVTWLITISLFYLTNYTCICKDVYIWHWLVKISMNQFLVCWDVSFYVKTEFNALILVANLYTLTYEGTSGLPTHKWKVCSYSPNFENVTFS